MKQLFAFSCLCLLTLMQVCCSNEEDSQFVGMWNIVSVESGGISTDYSGDIQVVQFLANGRLVYAPLVLRNVDGELVDKHASSEFELRIDYSYDEQKLVLYNTYFTKKYRYNFAEDGRTLKITLNESLSSVSDFPWTDPDLGMTFVLKRISNKK